MNKIRQYLTFTALIFSMMLFTGCEVDEIQVGTPQDLRIEELSFDKIKLEVLVPINNPNNFSFKIQNVDIDLSLNGRKLGKIHKIDKVKIPKKSNDIYAVMFEIKTSEAIGNIMHIIRDLQRGRPTIHLKGHISAGKMFIKKKILVDHVQTFDLY